VGERVLIDTESLTDNRPARCDDRSPDHSNHRPPTVSPARTRSCRPFSGRPTAVPSLTVLNHRRGDHVSAGRPCRDRPHARPHYRLSDGPGAVPSLTVPRPPARRPRERVEIGLSTVRPSLAKPSRHRNPMATVSAWWQRRWPSVQDVPADRLPHRPATIHRTVRAPALGEAVRGQWWRRCRPHPVIGSE
jgi:hypothetical protein